MVATVSAQVAIPIIAQNPIEVSGSIITNVVVNSNPDLDPCLFGQRAILNFSSSMGPVKSVLEIGTTQSINTLTRRAFLSFPIKDWEISAGQEYIDGSKIVLGQTMDENGTLDFCSRPGVMYTGRRLRLAAKHHNSKNSSTTLSIAEAIKPASGFRGSPKVFLSTTLKLGNLNLMSNTGYGYYQKGNDHYQAGITGLTAEHSNLFGTKTTFQIWKARNGSDLGMTTVPSGINEKSISRSAGGYIQASKSNITVGSGFAHVYSTGKKFGSVYAQYNFQLFKNLKFTPEIGYFWGNYQKHEMVYGTIRAITSF